MLHLLGHDHAQPDEHQVMFALQNAPVGRLEVEMPGGPGGSIPAAISG